MATDIPTPSLATKIRDPINYQIREELSSPSSLSVKITLRGFPHQTGESVTNLRCVDSFCHGQSIITIAGIGEGYVSAEAIITFIQWPPKLPVFAFQVTIDGLPAQTGTSSAFFEGQSLPLTSPVFIGGIGSGEETVQSWRRADILLPNSQLAYRPSLGENWFERSLIAEHGFSVVLKLEINGTEHKLLFDSGLSPLAAARNADVLDLDLSYCEAVISSHGHIDHAGGLLNIRRRYRWKSRNGSIGTENKVH
jgi:Metallo-beta-lactamase superfamily